MTHSLDNTSKRKTDILFMEFIANPAIHGTGYMYQGQFRSEHVLDPSITKEQKDPIITSAHGETIRTSSKQTVFETEYKINERIISALQGLENIFKHPLDVEYLFDNSGNMYIVQIRKISEPHLKNWQKVTDATTNNDNLESALQALWEGQ